MISKIFGKIFHKFPTYPDKLNIISQTICEKILLKLTQESNDYFRIRIYSDESNKNPLL